MRGWIPAAALLLAACAGADEPPAEAATADSLAAPIPTDAAAPISVDSAVALGTPAVVAPGAEAQDTGYTAWRALEMPSEPWTQQAASPEALLTRVRDVVAAQLEEPDASVLPARMQSQGADSAVAVLVHPDQADDSVRDIEFRLHMRREGAGWVVVAVDRRERCRRGVASGGLCA